MMRPEVSRRLPIGFQQLSPRRGRSLPNALPLGHAVRRPVRIPAVGVPDQRCGQGMVAFVTQAPRSSESTPLLENRPSTSHTDRGRGTMSLCRSRTGKRSHSANRGTCSTSGSSGSFLRRPSLRAPRIPSRARQPKRGNRRLPQAHRASGLRMPPMTPCAPSRISSPWRAIRWKRSVCARCQLRGGWISIPFPCIQDPAERRDEAGRNPPERLRVDRGNDGRGIPVRGPGNQ